eukprot:scaffold19808_cov157-Isochrysis_galbana.AAC.1
MLLEPRAPASASISSRKSSTTPEPQSPPHTAGLWPAVAWSPPDASSSPQIGPAAPIPLESPSPGAPTASTATSLASLPHASKTAASFCSPSPYHLDATASRGK